MMTANEIEMVPCAEVMPSLAKAVKDGRVSVKAMVYVNRQRGGLKVFLDDMEAQGVDSAMLKEGVHYVVNGAADKQCAQRPWTGEVWISGKTEPELMREIIPILEERDSTPALADDGVHIFSNPLARIVLGLGVWGEDKGFEVPARPKQASEEQTARYVKAKLAYVNENLARHKQEAAKATNLANAMRKAKMTEHAKDHAKVARSHASKVRELEALGLSLTAVLSAKELPNVHAPILEIKESVTLRDGKAD
jgi:hypothetical protein